MDPFSITVACASLLEGIAELTKVITTFVKQARDARKDVDAFNRELSSLHLCVSILNDEKFEFPDQLQKTLCSVLADCKTIIADMKRILSKHRAGGIGKSFTWAFSDREEVLALQGRLEARKTTLNITIDMASLVLIKAVKADTTLIKEDTRDIKAELEALRQEVNRFRLQQVGKHSMLDRFLSEGMTYTESIIDPLDGHDETIIAAGDLSDNAQGSQSPATSLNEDRNRPLNECNSLERSAQSCKLTALTDAGASGSSAAKDTTSDHDRPQPLATSTKAGAGGAPHSKSDYIDTCTFMNSGCRQSPNSETPDPEERCTQQSAGRESDNQVVHQDVIDVYRLTDLTNIDSGRRRRCYKSADMVALSKSAGVSEGPEPPGLDGSNNSRDGTQLNRQSSASMPPDDGDMKCCTAKPERFDAHSTRHDGSVPYKTEVHVSTILHECGSSLDDKEGALLWYMLETIDSGAAKATQVDWILEQGINVHACVTEAMRSRYSFLSDSQSLMALHIAAYHLDEATTSVLIKHEARYEEPGTWVRADGSPFTMSALELAMQGWDLGNIRALLSAGASSKHVDKSMVQWNSRNAVYLAFGRGPAATRPARMAEQYGIEAHLPKNFNYSDNEAICLDPTWRRCVQNLNEKLCEQHYRGLLACFGWQAKRDGEWREFPYPRGLWEVEKDHIYQR